MSVYEYEYMELMTTTGINFVALKYVLKQEGQRGLSEALNKAHFPQYSMRSVTLVPESAARGLG